MEGYYESPAMGAPEAGRARTKRIYRERAAEPDWAMEPLDPERFDFRLCADGRLVEIIDKDWQATVRSVPLDDYGGPEGKGACDYPMMLGKIKGKFHILR